MVDDGEYESNGQTLDSDIGNQVDDPEGNIYDAEMEGTHNSNIVALVSPNPDDTVTKEMGENDRALTVSDI